MVGPLGHALAWAPSVIVRREVWYSSSHFGNPPRGNDLCLMKGKGLVIQTQDDLLAIMERWPGVQVVFFCHVALPGEV